MVPFVYVHAREQMDKKATVKEIARLAGVSIGTVDRVLHGRSGVSIETKTRVDAIIESLGYTPNILARQLSLNKNYLFRAILPRSDQDSGYWALCSHGIRRAARDLASFRVRVRIDEFDRYDSAAYRALLDDAVREPGDGLLIAPVLPFELVPALVKLEGRIPYVFFDGSVEGAAPLAVIGQDAFAGGYLAGRMLALLAGSRPGPLIALNAHAEDRHIALRIRGFSAFHGEQEGASRRDIREYSCFELEHSESADSFLEGLFRQLPDIAGFLVANSSGHLVGDWLLRSGRKAGCALVSWDLVPQNVRCMREGGIDCLISQRPYEQAREGLERLFRSVVERAEGEGDVKVPLDVYFRENLPQRALGAEEEHHTPTAGVTNQVPE
ncbi:MAG TPA: LacI family DNA-binding transcriptional regulator [Rectinemataceae bacterium]|nr:LacI family DNA-binding transcriptional regulator [Rectinemataceae bacterium]